MKDMKEFIEKTASRLSASVKMAKETTTENLRSLMLTDLRDGDSIFETPALHDVTLMWVGQYQREDGTKVAGGLFEDQYFRMAYKISVKTETIHLDSGETNIDVYSRIDPITWGELVDLAYEYKMVMKNISEGEINTGIKKPERS